MRKKGIPDILARSMVSVYEGEKTRVRVDCELSEVSKVNVGRHRGSVLSTFTFAVEVDVVTELTKECAK